MSSASRYQSTFNSFSGADIIAVITPQNGGKARVLGELQTISYSVFRPTAPVFALGRIGAKGAVRGARTVAGSLIFTVFDRHVLYDVMKDMQGNSKYRPMKSDEIPAFDVTINFLNEYGQAAQMIIYGVHLMSEGQTMSIEDMITENVMEFIALDIDTMIPDAVKEHWDYDYK
ncbi:virion structural protein [Cytobacillus oceanisediminis]|uniref:virion structural protein n=1 Tax=Cytobacillus oceanisediminis TaxID=665099 RepID=UPI001FB41FED|nr:virion structural protein [Cytobacillus oceanisediminis]UOE58085.1 virion structural protein [Cytobacillus oceanisediminis]